MLISRRVRPLSVSMIRKGDDVAVRSLQPNQGVEEKKAGPCGWICIWSGCFGGPKRGGRKAEDKDRRHCPCCIPPSAHFSLQCPRVDGYKTLHREHNHQPGRGVCSVGKCVPPVAPRLVTPKRAPHRCCSRESSRTTVKIRTRLSATEIAIR